MTTTLWIIQGLLALAFLGAGAMKAIKRPEQLVEMGLAWAEDFSDGKVRAIGVLEILGGLGLILPVALGILPVLTGVAAVGLTLTMVGAIVVHLRRGEIPQALPALVLGALSAYVAFSHLG